MSSGESQIRQVLYAKNYIKNTLDLDIGWSLVDWEPDTFGHPKTTPKILNSLGIDYYYLHKAGAKKQPDFEAGKYGNRPRIFRWGSEEGSKLLVWNDGKLHYRGHVNPEEAKEVLNLEEETGLKDYMIVYGVGDHGGGPSRKDLEKIKVMDDWPIFPNTKFDKFQEFMELAEEEGSGIPVVWGEELNFVLRGCYTSQSKIKHSNRKMENDLPTAESLAMFANIYTEYDYPTDNISEAWKKACFNQFHDLLPGSGVEETVEHAQANFQEVEALTSTVIENSVDALSDKIDPNGKGIPLIVFNPTSYRRTDEVEFVIYGTETNENLVAKDVNGNSCPIQVLESTESIKSKLENQSF